MDATAQQAIKNLVNSWRRVQNVGALLDDDLLGDIGRTVVEEYEMDVDSRKDWEKRNEDALKLATLVSEEKSFPWPGASNVVYPALANASIQFASRVYPNIVSGRDVVKGRVVGKDPEGVKAARAERIGQHMSYQLLCEMEEWEDDMDTMLVALPVVGCTFKKTYFNQVLQRNVSAFVSPDRLVVNYKAKNIDVAPRKTEEYSLYPNEIEERRRSEFFNDVEVERTNNGEDGYDSADKDAPHKFLEQHRWLDLDEDGYKEPYVVTVHFDTKKVMRIVARFDMEGIKTGHSGKIIRIEPVEYYTRFLMMPSPDAGVYGQGFGSLLSPMNNTINTVINQLLDAGTMANTGGGFLGKGIQLGRGRGGGEVSFKPNEWKYVNMTGDDLKRSIVPLPVREPSSVLFQLLGLMLDASEKLGSNTEILSGVQGSASQTATTTLALIEQGLKVFSAIYKRIHRSLKSEYKKLYRLNSLFLEEEAYFTYFDSPQAIARKDYNILDIDVVPVSDPSEVTDIQRLKKAEALMGMKGQGLNDGEITNRMVEALQVPNAKALQLPKDTPPPKDPAIEVQKDKNEVEREKNMVQMRRVDIEANESEARIVRMDTEGIKNLALAEAAESGQQISLYKTFIGEMKVENEKRKQDGERNASGVGAPSGNKGGVQMGGGPPAPSNA